MTYIKRIPFDRKGAWQITLLQAIQAIQQQNVPNIATTTDAAMEVSNKPSNCEIAKRTKQVIAAFLQNPKETGDAMREAFQEVFGKPTKISYTEISWEEIKTNVPVTIRLPDGTPVTVGSRALDKAFKRNPECPRLLYVLRNKEALTRYSGPKILACRSSNPEETNQAIYDAVKEVEEVFPKDPNQKPIIVLKTIEKHDPVLSITLPTGETLHISMESLDQLLSATPPTLLTIVKNPAANTLVQNQQLLDALQGENREAIIQKIRQRLDPDVNLGASDAPISFQIDDSSVWISTHAKLFDLLRRNHRNNPKIPTLTSIRDNTYQNTAAAAASVASSSPSPSPEKAAVQVWTAGQQDSMG